MKNNTTKGNSLKINTITLVLATGIFIVISVVTVLIHLQISKATHTSTATATNSAVSTDDPPAMNLIRGNDLKLINKLYLADLEKESSKFQSLKADLNGMISQAGGPVKSVAVYFRDLTDGSWMSINGDNLFYPGSLIKVPILIYYLKEEREHKGTLEKELVYTKPKQFFPSQIFKGDSILNGRKYKISELLKYMIVESDNNATHLLSQNMKNDPFCKIFSDLEIPPDRINDVDYKISARNFSKFFRVLYSSTYLSRRYSEYALELLAQSKFDLGISRNLPKDIVIAHKFGESGRNFDMDFSETAIVYRDNGPYLLTVMTEGTDAKKQADLVSKISDKVYGFLAKKPGS